MPSYQTDALEVTLVDPNQTGKAVSINEGIDGLASALAKSMALDMGTLSSPYTLPYDSAEGGDKSGLHVIMYRVTGSPGTATEIVHPAVEHLFLVVNATDADVTFKCSGQPGTTLATGDSTLMYCNGTDVEDAGTLQGSVGGIADFGFASPNGIVPTTSQVIGRTVAARTIYVPADMAGSKGYIATNPTASFAIDVKVDGTSIGTITISTGGAFTFATSGGIAQVIASGSRIEFVAPATVDATAAGIAATILATS